MTKTKNILIVFGTRPEAIKLAPIIIGLKNSKTLNCKVCVTAQHRQMLDQVLDVFCIVPDIDLNLMKPDQSLADLTANAIQKLYRVFVGERPDMVLVQGDTTTVFCAAMASFYAQIPIGHVEAGLRTGNLYAPWPEEANRTLTTRLAALHFAPTIQAKNNLMAEGISSSFVHVTGNTAIDALFYTQKRLNEFSAVINSELESIAHIPKNEKTVLITGHRRESFGKGFEQICKAIYKLAIKFPNVHFVYPVHLNPNVRKPVERHLKPENLANIHLLEPLTYPSFVYAMSHSYLILTDSGGIQEEAPSLGKPVLVMRETTERPESLNAGCSVLVGNDEKKIFNTTSRLLTDGEYYGNMAKVQNPYGDGNSANKIITICNEFFVNRRDIK